MLLHVVRQRRVEKLFITVTGEMLGNVSEELVRNHNALLDFCRMGVGPFFDSVTVSDLLAVSDIHIRA